MMFEVHDVNGLLLKKSSSVKPLKFVACDMTTLLVPLMRRHFPFSSFHESIQDEEEHPLLDKIVRPLATPDLANFFFGDFQFVPNTSPSLPKVVQHEYNDHADKTEKDTIGPISRGGVAIPFPIKLHELLDKIEADGLAHVVSWQPHGRCFIVHKQKEFTEEVMPKYFKMSKFPSFLRQLNLYGFIRLTRNGPDRGGYYHELFLQDKVFLAYHIPRMRIKGNGVRARSNPDSEPDFYSMKPVEKKSEAGSKKTDSPGNKNAEDCGLDKKSCQHALLPACQLDATKPTVEDEKAHEEYDFAGRRFYSIDDDVSDIPQRPKDVLSREENERFLSKLNISTHLYNDILRSSEDDSAFGRLIERLLVETDN